MRLAAGRARPVQPVPPASLAPCSPSWLPVSSEVSSGGSPYTTQWMKLPPGASGSSTTSASSTVPTGGSSQASAGETFSPSQLNRGSIGSPSETSPPVNVKLVVLVAPVGAVGAASSSSPPQAVSASTSGTTSATTRRMPGSVALGRAAR